MTIVNCKSMGKHINCDGCGDDISRYTLEEDCSIEYLKSLSERHGWISIDDKALSKHTLHYCIDCQRERGYNKIKTNDKQLNLATLINYLNNQIKLEENLIGFGKGYNYGRLDAYKNVLEFLKMEE